MPRPALTHAPESRGAARIAATTSAAVSRINLRIGRSPRSGTRGCRVGYALSRIRAASPCGSLTPSTPSLPCSDTHPHALHVRVQIERVAPELTAVPALLVTAEGRHDVEHVVAVHPHGAGADGAGHAVRLRHVARPHAGGETVERVVALQHGVVLVLERNERHHRSEDLLLRDAHVVAHAGEDSGLDEVAVRQMLGRVALTAGEDLRPFLLADVEVASHTLELLLAHQRAHLRPLFESGALLHRRSRRGDGVGEL